MLAIPDVIAPDLDVLFCGINPGLYSAKVGHHFARPGNRFWPTLHRAGFAPRFLAIVGIGAYRTAFARPRATLGLQDETIGATKIWVLPNPSGLNANYRPADLVKLYGDLRAAAVPLPVRQ